MPEYFSFSGIRQELLPYEMAGIIMGIFIVFTVVELFHQAGRRIAQMKWHRKIACLPDKVKSRIDRQIGGVAFGGCREIDRTLGERNPSLRPAYLMNRIKRGIGKKKRVRVSESRYLPRRESPVGEL